MIDGTYVGIPEATRGALVRYVVWGYSPGSALSAVLSNDLKEAVARCDEDSWAGVREVISWLYNHAPSECYGSLERFQAWGERDLSKLACLRDGLQKFADLACVQSIDALEKLRAEA